MSSNFNYVGPLRHLFHASLRDDNIMKCKKKAYFSFVTTYLTPKTSLKEFKPQCNFVIVYKLVMQCFRVA